MVTLDQFCDERAHSLEHSQHRRADAQLGGAQGGLGFVRSVDPEQFGALAWDAHHVLAMVSRRNEVSVRDAAAQWTNLHDGLIGKQTALAHEPLHVCPLVHNQRCSTS
jgi:hypothetical protein